MIEPAEQRLLSSRSGEIARPTEPEVRGTGLVRAAPPAAPEGPAAAWIPRDAEISQKPIDLILRSLVQGAWRRRFLIIMPILLMIPLGIAAALLLPRGYVAQTLLVLGEISRDSPLGGSSVLPESIPQRVAALEALLKSDRVLLKAVNDIGLPENRPSPNGLALRLRELRESLSVELIGSDFVAIRLKGTEPSGLGKQLQAVISRLFEALLADHDSVNATELVTRQSSQDLQAAERALDELRQKRQRLLPEGPEAAAKQLLGLQMRLEGKRRELASAASESAKSVALSGIKQLEETAQRKMQILDQYRRLDRQIGVSQRELASARKTHEALLGRYGSMRPALGVGVLTAPAQIRVIDPPKDPKFATTSRALIVLSGLAASLLLGIGLAWGAELLDSTIRQTDELAAATGLPLLAHLPKMDGNGVHDHVAKTLRTRASPVRRWVLAGLLVITMGGIGYVAASRPEIPVLARDAWNDLTRSIEGAWQRWIPDVP